MPPVRSNTIRRTRPDVSAIEHPAVKGTRRTSHTFREGTKRMKGYVRGELTGPLAGPRHTSGRTLLGKVRPDA
ncbi:hypothetical protein Sfulv_10970 [Streptomyces fulvorobeus]|uniref:Uncharacterized protein n=1 Tax=Streptomyces fulvorobeus TaxID=284028 RepID=A0A7J0C3H1_9ACTN|nr:hypothetical protein Sfulv_10970 [Streptomyces fulvorobeus]